MTVEEAMAHRQKHKPNKIIMKDFFLKLIFSRIGPAIAAIVSTILGFLVTKLAGLGIMLDAQMQSHIAYALSGLIWLTVNQLVNRYLGDRVEIIQKAYGVDADRWLGDVTTNAATDPNRIPQRPTEILP